MKQNLCETCVHWYANWDEQHTMIMDEQAPGETCTNGKNTDMDVHVCKAYDKIDKRYWETI